MHMSLRQNNLPAFSTESELTDGWFLSVFIEELWDNFDWSVWSGVEWFDKISSSTDSLIGEISLLLDAEGPSAIESECLLSTVFE